MPPWIRLYRVAVPLLALAAITAQLHETVVVRHGSAANFFSYFTIHSNLLAAVVLMWCSVRPGSLPAWRDTVRGAATLYLSITGVVYAVLLAEEEARLHLIIPWVDVVIHRVMPLVILLDWLLVPPSPPPTWCQALAWMIYPLTFMVYTLIRGPIVGWYPYPFIDPSRAGGVTGVALHCAGITASALVFAWIVMALGRWRRKGVESFAQ